jgi:hypothetical protein
MITVSVSRLVTLIPVLCKIMHGPYDNKKGDTNFKNAAHETHKNGMTQFKSEGLNIIVVHNISLMVTNGLIPRSSYH